MDRFPRYEDFYCTICNCTHARGALCGIR
jgi:hypothetical protein